jgi:uncharacterized membrane protein YqjE
MTDAADVVECPYCGAACTVDPAAAIQSCPVCAQEFILDADADVDPDAAAREASEARIRRDRERLDERHIRLVQLELRGLYRGRTWVLVIGLACFGVIAQMIYLAVRFWPQFHARRVAAYVVVIALLGATGAWMLRQARRYRRRAEAEAAALWKNQPAGEPDFSTLSDGSQFADELAAMHRRDG